jgi:pilus assembly protein CpaE
LIKVVSSDPRLPPLLRETGMAVEVVGQEALGMLAQPGAPQPEVLAVDLRGQAQFPDVVALLKRRHPSTPVLLVLSQLDPAVMLEAMRAGVNECVIDPVAQPELRAALKRLVKNHSATAGEVFAFVGAKGGVGATTTVVNVAAALSKATPDSTLLIDLNVAFGDAAVFLGEEPRFSVLDALENVQRLDSTYFGSLVTRTVGGLDLLAASGRPIAGSMEAGRIRSLLDFASRTRRYTLLDVPRSDTATLDALELATRIVIVVNQELATVRTATRIAATLRQRYGRERLRLVLTRTDRKAEISREDVERTVGVEIEHTIPSDYRSALSAMNKGRPVVLEYQNELSQAFSAYARQLAGLPEPEREERVRSTSVFGRLSPKRA